MSNAETTAADRTDDDASLQAIRNEARLHAERSASLPLPFTVTEGMSLLYQSHRRGLTLEDVVADEVNDWRPGDPWHRAVWHGVELLAVIRARGRVGRGDPPRRTINFRGRQGGTTTFATVAPGRRRA